MITLKEVKQQIDAGKVPLIYYSVNTLWWTHDINDVKEATAIGSKAFDKSHEEFMNDKNISETEKENKEFLYNLCKQNDIEIPCDPTGSPLFQTTDVKQWISLAEAKPDHFGKHGIKAFMKSHHQNSDGQAHSKWNKYNEMVDKNK